MTEIVLAIINEKIGAFLLYVCVTALLVCAMASTKMAKAKQKEKATKEIEDKNNTQGKQITKIVLTGGQCGGKTTAKEYIKNRFEKEGYKVLFVSESATELISGGISKRNADLTQQEFQKLVIKMEIAKEAVFEEAARYVQDEKVLIVADRGIPDGRAFLSDEDMDAILEEVGITAADSLNRYDAVFHMTTSAKGNGENYTLENNPARSGTREQAIKQDDALMRVWAEHKYVRIIDNADTFEEKANNLIEEIKKFLENRCQQ